MHRGPTRQLMTELRRNFDDLFLWENMAKFNPHPLSPRISNSETEDAFIFTIDAPGFKIEDLDIRVEKDTLTVQGKREKETPEDYRLLRQERPKMDFSHQERMPDGVNNIEVSATLNDGLLTIIMPKQEESKPRKITVNAKEKE
jgi:HSP20 family protein